MPVEIQILAWGAVLLLVHIYAAGLLKTRQYGTLWNVGPRDDEMPAPGRHTGRLIRAQANFMETFPVAIIALFGVVMAGRTSSLTALGGWLWLGSRVIYMPLYYAGVPYLRSVAYTFSIIGLGMVLWPLLAG